MKESHLDIYILEELKKKGFTEENGVIIEYQGGSTAKVKRLLANASKQLTGNKGVPEFIITFENEKDLIVVIECKGDTKKHESIAEEKFSAADYAVDGIMHYSPFLAKEYNVIGIAISADTKENIKINNFYLSKGGTKENIERLKDENILYLEEYMNFYRTKINVTEKYEKREDIIKYSKILHNYLRDYAKLAENEKPLLISGILIALENEVFSSSYKVIKTDKELAEELYGKIEAVIKANIKNNEGYVAKIKQTYSFIKVHAELNSTVEMSLPEKEEDLKDVQKIRVLGSLVYTLDKKIVPFIKKYHDLDIVGDFYGEFLRYTGGDKKALGIVLTPTHITELFSEIAQVNPGDKILDTCAGTGGFIISAHHKVKEKIGNSEEKLNELNKSLIAVEQQAHMYTLCVSNMILRGIKPEKIYAENSFEIKGLLASEEPDVTFLNPPYAQKGEGLSEMDFIKNALDCTKKGGTVVAIVPNSCAISNEIIKKELLKEHTLDAVMSMPEELFYPVGTITCIMVFKAKKPHPQGFKTWFGYWKNDGFEKTKISGRIDLNHSWEKIKNNWIKAYLNREEVLGMSVLKEVTAMDEWLAEAYMETDYSQLTEESFINTLKKYVAYKFLNSEV